MLLKTVDNTLLVLELLSENAMTQKEVESRTGFDRSAVRRILFSLQSRNYIEKDELGYFHVGLKVVEIASIKLNQMELKTEAVPILRKLSKSLNQVCHMGVLKDDEVVYIEKIEPLNSIRMFSSIGKRMPVYCTGMGKSLLIDKSDDYITDIFDRNKKAITSKTIEDSKVFLDEVKRAREKEYSVDNEENENGIFCIASPIYDYRGNVIAAISSSGKFEDYLTDEQIIGQVRNAARQISEKLGYLKKSH